MTPSRDDVIRMAREAGLTANSPYVRGKLERFAALVAANKAAELGAFYMQALDEEVEAEREACAEACRDLMGQFDQEAQSGDLDEAGRMHREGAAAGAMACEAAIRARSTKP